MTAKQALMELATALPDDVEWEEAEYQLFLRRRVEECREAEEKGAVYTVDEARAAIKQWTNTR